MEPQFIAVVTFGDKTRTHHQGTLSEVAVWVALRTPADVSSIEVNRVIAQTTEADLRAAITRDLAPLRDWK